MFGLLGALGGFLQERRELFRGRLKRHQAEVDSINGDIGIQLGLQMSLCVCACNNGRHGGLWRVRRDDDAGQPKWRRRRSSHSSSLARARAAHTATGGF